MSTVDPQKREEQPVHRQAIEEARSVLMCIEGLPHDMDSVDNALALLDEALGLSRKLPPTQVNSVADPIAYVQRSDPAKAARMCARLGSPNSVGISDRRG